MMSEESKCKKCTKEKMFPDCTPDSAICKMAENDIIVLECERYMPKLGAIPQNFHIEDDFLKEIEDEELRTKSEEAFRRAIKDTIETLGNADQKCLVKYKHAVASKNYESGDFMIVEVFHEVKTELSENDSVIVDESTLNDFSVKVVACSIWVMLDEEKNSYFVQHDRMFTSEDFPKLEVMCY